ncbi:hypothetical protein WJU16_03160 [Chitinophaga pollutisoli]|uniref:Uncharacterized protein n=1 Tax=Chitinophaga pollutisoli TaxID=3133966 RepID=A0ABZ2YS07_9BACT
MMIGLKNMHSLRKLLKEKSANGAVLLLGQKTGIIEFDKLRFLNNPKHVLKVKKEHEYMFLIKDLLEAIDYLTNNKDDYSFFAADIDDIIVNIGMYQTHVECAIILEQLLRQNQQREHSPQLSEFIILSANEFIAELCKSQQGANLANKIWEKFHPSNIPKPQLLNLSQSPRIKITDNPKNHYRKK